MLLYNEGKISLEDKVTKHLSWFSSEADENIQNITIFHLLTHTSGLSCDGKKSYYGADQLPTLDCIKKQIMEGLSTSKTNESVNYSNIGYLLLGQIIEEVSKQEYGQFIQTRIFEPLEMKSSFVDVNDENRLLHATGHGMKYPKKEREQYPLYSSGIFQPAAGISSTTEDLIKFYQAHLFGNEILIPDSLKREMQRIQVKMGTSIRGLGFALSNNPEGKIASHLGGEIGFRSMSGLIQDGRIIITVFINATNVHIDDFFYSLCHLVTTLDSAKEMFLQDSEDKTNFKKLVGFYDSLKSWGPELFCQIGSKLVLLNPEAKYPIGAMQILNHKDDYVFIPTKESPTAKPGEEIQFTKGPENEIIHLDSKKGEHKRFSFSY